MKNARTETDTPIAMYSLLLERIGGAVVVTFPSIWPVVANIVVTVLDMLSVVTVLFVSRVVAGSVEACVS